MNGWIFRLRAMALGWGTVGIVYTTAALAQGSGTAIPETALDRLIPFDPRGIWLYLSFFALIPFAYLRAEALRLPWLARSMQLSAIVSGVVFVLYPTTLSYPLFDDASIPTRLLRLLIAGDSSQNCLPSLHAALTYLSVWALADARRPWQSALAALWGLAIACAMVQTRRHLALDTSAGLLVALVCGAIASRRPFRSMRMLP
ncbi:phosphatase PAP2 family protein [Cupriavidus basilensis]|uniref:phosphatase PAP2 family protein n=1 Tax=Cupriavidus basilensis TaxID=68895 RepID=UPI00075088A1|nr:phosphatase PAP2 family protein [Cupriavidus basilensis]